MMHSWTQSWEYLIGKTNIRFVVIALLIMIHSKKTNKRLDVAYTLVDEDEAIDGDASKQQVHILEKPDLNF